MRRFVLAAVVVLGVVVGCSSDEGGADDRLARSAVLRPGDLGRGWRTVHLPDRRSITETCPGFVGEPTGVGRSGHLVRGRASVENQVAVWVDDRAAQRHLRQLAARSTMRCVERLIRSDTKRAIPQLDEVDVHVSRTSVRHYGDARAGFDAEITETIGPDVRTFHLATVYVRSGRTVLGFSFGDWPTPPVPSSAAIRAALARLEGVDQLA